VLVVRQTAEDICLETSSFIIMLHVTFRLIGLLILSTPILGADYGKYLVTAVINVYDGDTLRVNIQDLPPIIGQNIRVRLRDIDTPEMQAQCFHEYQQALLARDRLHELVSAADIIELKNVQRGKYFRIVADLILDGENAGDILIHEKLAIRYDGGRKTHQWC